MNSASPVSRPLATSGVALKTGIVVIGAGQADRSAAYHLKRRGLVPHRGFVVLDESPKPGAPGSIAGPP